MLSYLEPLKKQRYCHKPCLDPEGLQRERSDAQQGDDSISVADYRRSAERIKKAVAGGKMSEGDAERKLLELRKRVRDRR